MLNGVVVVGRHRRVVAVESHSGHKKEFGRTIAEAKVVVEEEVVEFVWTNEVFGLLAYIAVFVGRNQFWANRSVDNVKQRESRLGVYIVVGNISHQMAYESFWYACVYSIHRHVVAVVCGPAKSQFAEVSSAYYQSSNAVGHVHEYLCSFPRL